MQKVSKLENQMPNHLPNELQWEWVGHCNQCSQVLKGPMDSQATHIRCEFANVEVSIL